MATELSFPRGFRFGAATAAAQIEGAASADGKGPSIWDTFTAIPGKISDSSNIQVACDHYNRFLEDVELLRELGVSDYRFSVSWPRIMPHGTGEINEAGLKFYDRLVDALVAAGIRPVVTLYHWDLPQALQDTGGWMSRATAEAFVKYVEIVVARLGDRVKHWFTLNEMTVHTMYGHALTDHAPGLGIEMGALGAAHNMLLAHGLAVAKLRELGVDSVGPVNAHFPVHPGSGDEQDAAAAAIFDQLVNWTFADPILRGCYPSDEIAGGVMLAAGITPEQLAADLEIISAPIDVYGVNYYEPATIVSPDSRVLQEIEASGALEVEIPEGMPFVAVPYEATERTDFGWAIAPEGLSEILLRLRERYPDMPPVIITESGASFHDQIDDSGVVADPRRIAYHREHLSAVLDAISRGCDVRGYYVWSLLDNFEWAAGYKERFGLVYVNFETLERTKKQSFEWYRELIAGQLR